MRAVEHFNDSIQNAAWDRTPIVNKYTETDCSKHIRELVTEKRKFAKCGNLLDSLKIKHG